MGGCFLNVYNITYQQAFFNSAQERRRNILLVIISRASFMGALFALYKFKEGGTGWPQN